MTDRERQFAALGFEHAEGIDHANVIIVPSTGREIRKTRRLAKDACDDCKACRYVGCDHPECMSVVWECQPWNDNYWREFDGLLDAAKFATRPKRN